MRGDFLDRRRASTFMRERGLDALVLAAPETLLWATGAFAGVATLWRRGGAAFLVVPQSPDEAIAAIVGDLQARDFKRQSGLDDVRTHRLWVETGRYDDARFQYGGTSEAVVSSAGGLDRPATFDLEASVALLRDAMTEKGLARGRVGLELGFVPAADFLAISAGLPDIALVDATSLVAHLRALKHLEEVARLRHAAVCAMAGATTLLEALRPGLDAAAMTALWRDAARAESQRRGAKAPESDWAYIAVGGDGFAPGNQARPGDLVKIDVGCVVGGYSSDGARTAVIGRPNLAQRAVYDALRAGFDVGAAMLGPGVKLAEIHRAVTKAIHDHGLPQYRRGHFGHGVGASVWSEEWPFIAADSDAFAEPGMTLAFETPFYVEDLGGFIIEDQFLIGERDVEVMAPAARDLYLATD